jgi:hypothetical protein
MGGRFARRLWHNNHLTGRLTRRSMEVQLTEERVVLR